VLRVRADIAAPFNTTGNMRGKLRIGTLILSVDIEQDLKGSMEKTLGNVEVDPDKFAILRSPETQKLLAMARYLMGVSSGRTIS
jgi:hypothetical protein